MKTNASQRGSTLVLSMMVVAVTSVLVGLAITVTSHTGRNAARSRALDAATAIGDGYLEAAFAQWRTLCQARPNIPPLASDIDLSPARAVAEGQFQTAGPHSVSNFQIQAFEDIDRQGPGRPAPSLGENPSESSYLYLASVDVTVPAIGGVPLTARVRRVFEKRMESPWKYAIFFNDILEINPNPDFQVDGWVHSNQALYAISSSGRRLEFGDRVTYGSYYRETFLDGDAQRRGYVLGENDPRIAAMNKPTFLDGITPTQESRKDPFGMSPSQFSTTDANPNNDGYRELIERADPNFPDPLEDSAGNNPRFYDQASVKVLVDAGNNLTIYNASGQEIRSNGPNWEQKFYEAVAGALSTNEIIHDKREKSSVRLVTLDVGKLKARVNAIDGFNGVVYISDVSATPTARRGVRLRNGREIPRGGLTVVSDNPVYIQGDYNTGAQREGCAVIGDAVNILSNAWKDSASSRDLSGRIACDTTVNAAIMGGIVPTKKNESAPAKSTYSGGAVNFARYLENWTCKTITYNGSMVEMFLSQQATGTWAASGVFLPPIRNWAFDRHFLTSPPPGIFLVTSYVKQRWYLE